MKILVTGSHFTPAQAVIEALQKMGQQQIVYIGRSYTREGDKSPSLESEVLPKMGVKFINLTTGRLQRGFTRYTIPSLLKIPVGFVQAFYLLLKEKPAVVVSFGGYVAVPVVISAWLLSIPVIIHEQTLVTGLANKITAFFADKIAVTFDSKYFFPKEKIILTGNPMRREITAPKEAGVWLPKTDKLPLILVTGGNQGAHVINTIVENALSDLTEKSVVVHQTGDSNFKDYDRLLELKAGLKNPQRYIVKKYLSAVEMGQVLRRADLAISRAGANTLLELAYWQVPTIVVPIINHYEQQTNAKYFMELGLARVVKQQDWNSSNLLKDVESMFFGRLELKAHAKRAKELVIPDADKRLALEVLLLARGNRV